MSDRLQLFDAPQEAKTSDDYYTPKWIFDAMGLEFDLDVAAPPGGVPWLPAKRWFTKADDGLSREWRGRVWMNPPYSETTAWAHRWLEHGHGVALMPNAKSAWHIDVWGGADAIVVPDRYFPFSRGQIFMPVFFAAMGRECVDAISKLGVRRMIA